jgi:2-polyprenyl-6-methoxyphenol hydroxylase-like FAD-dependent oxidoreductase
MSAFHQPNLEAYLVLQCEAHGIPLYRRWNFIHSNEDRRDGSLTVHFQRHTSGLRNVYNHQVDVNCKWLIGCDGANSTVRQHAGLKQQDLLFQYDWLVVDLVSILCRPMTLAVVAKIVPSLFSFPTRMSPNL